MPDYHSDRRNRTQLCMIPGFIDADTGDLVPPNSTAGIETDLHPSNWHRALHINDLVPYQAEASTDVFALPKDDVMVEQHTIIIRELSRTVDQARLKEFLWLQNLQGQIQLKPDETRAEGKTSERRRCYALVEFTTSQEAIEAVRRLNGRQLADRCLDVRMAKDAETIHKGSRERAGSLASDASTSSSSVATPPSSGRQRRGPIIADGSV